MVSIKKYLITVRKHSIFPMFLKFLFFYFSAKLLIYSFKFVFSLGLLSIANIEMQSSSDVCLNDFYYRINTIEKNQIPLSQNIILINSGSLSKEKFRPDLADLLTVLKANSPKVIGIDHDFDSANKKYGTEKLVSLIQSTPNLILGKDSLRSNRFNLKSSSYGYVNFPKSTNSIRYYYEGNNTFAAKISKEFNKKTIFDQKHNDKFVINYISQDYYNISSNNYPFNSYTEFTFSPYSNQFPMLEGSDVLLNNEWNKKNLKKFIKNKIVLIGHMGSKDISDYRNDVEDKFAVPCDTSSFFFRQKTMSGLQIHANAIENLITPENKFIELNKKTWFVLIEELLLIFYICILIFMRVGKIFNIILMLALSIPLLYLVIFGMKHLFYIEMGGTLLSLLIFEELIEMIEPIYKKVESKLSTIIS